MSQSPAAAGRGSRTLPSGLLVAAAVTLALFFLVWVGTVLAILPPLPARPQTDALTGYVSLLGDFVARLAALGTLGALAAVAAFTGSGDDGAVTGEGRRLARWAARFAQVWFAAATLMTFANPAFVNGVPIGYTYGAWGTFQAATASGLAWTISALVALGSVLVTLRSRRIAAYALAWLAGVLSLVFVAVTGNVSVGLDHDWATDATIVGGLALLPLLSAAIGLVLARSTHAGAPSSSVRAYQRALPALVVVAVAAQVLVTWQELAGRPLLEVFTGVPTLGLFGCLVALLLAWGWRQVTGRLREVGDDAAGVLVPDVVIAVAYLAFTAAATHIPPPRFLIPQSTQVNYLGYEVTIPATVERLAGLGRPNLLWLVLCLTAIGAYALAMVRVRRRGGRWPVPRLISWVAGWGLTLYLAVSGLWEYSTALYSWHMLVHMTVNMLVPILCVFGAPFALIAAAGQPDEQGPRGLARIVAALGAYRPLQLLLSPPVLWVVYVGSLFAVYFSPLFPWLMRYHWAHQLMLLYFMGTGYAFFSLIVGVDRHAWRLPYLMRYVLLMSVMPFHAIFAVGIMMAASLIGAEFYQTIAVTWVPDLMADQQTAGQITWFTGEIPIFIAVVAVAAQWFREDRTDASRTDALAGTDDDPLDAYNDLLAQLAEHDKDLQRQAVLDRIRREQ